MRIILNVGNTKQIEIEKNMQEFLTSKDIEITEINMNTEPSGFFEISFEGIVKNNNIEWDHTINFKYNIVSFFGLLKDVIINKVSFDHNGSVTLIEGKANSIDRYIKVKFKGSKKEKDILSSNYDMVYPVYGKLEEMTYNEFRQKLMMEQI